MTQRTRAAAPGVGERGGRGGVTARASGNLEFCNPGNLRVAAPGRFSDFQVFTAPPPGPRWRPSGWGDDSGGFSLRRNALRRGSSAMLLI